MHFLVIHAKVHGFVNLCRGDICYYERTCIQRVHTRCFFYLLHEKELSVNPARGSDPKSAAARLVNPTATQTSLSQRYETVPIAQYVRDPRVLLVSRDKEARQARPRPIAREKEAEPLAILD